MAADEAGGGLHRERRDRGEDFVALEVPDNLQVGLLDPQNLQEIYQRLDRRGTDAIVLSACVQMPSLPITDAVEAEAGLPVVSAAVCTTYRMLKSLGLEARAPAAGALLSGRF